MVRLEPAVIVLPLAGLVMEMTGVDVVKTLIVMGLEVVETPLVSVALAVKVKVPAVAFVQLAVYGEVVAVANKYDPL